MARSDILRKATLKGIACTTESGTHSGGGRKRPERMWYHTPEYFKLAYGGSTVEKKPKVNVPASIGVFEEIFGKLTPSEQALLKAKLLEE